MELLAAVSVAVSMLVSVVHAVLAVVKAREPRKDPIWEAALQLTLAQNNGVCNPDEFATNYEELKAFKANGCTLGDCNSLSTLVKEQREKTTP